MAQAQIALDTRRSPSRIWTRFAGTWANLKARHEARRTIARMLAERELGRSTGARI